MILHDQGKLSFDDDVRKYVPELPAYHPRQPIRIHHLLHHASGLPMYGDLDVPKTAGRKPDYVCNEDFAPEFARQRAKFPPHFLPGEKLEYNNGGYMLLALIVQHVSKKSFGTFLHEHVFAPLQMRHSWVYESPRVKSLEPAMGYCKGDKTPFQAYYGCPPFKNESWLCCGGSDSASTFFTIASTSLRSRAGRSSGPAPHAGRTRASVAVMTQQAR
jgi:CubicO group peptidase (beta-lactamase class C family)